MDMKSIRLGKGPFVQRFIGLAVVMTLISTSLLADDIVRRSLDDAAAIGTTIRTDTRIKVEGKGSVRITTRHPTVVCLGEVTGPDIEGATLVYRAQVKSALEGATFLEMWAHIGGGQYFSRGMNSLVEGQADWTVIQTPFIFQEGQRPDKVTLNIVINGKGTVWVDDIVLAKEPLP